MSLRPPGKPAGSSTASWAAGRIKAAAALRPTANCPHVTEERPPHLGRRLQCPALPGPRPLPPFAARLRSLLQGIRTMWSIGNLHKTRQHVQYLRSRLSRGAAMRPPRPASAARPGPFETMGPKAQGGGCRPVPSPRPHLNALACPGPTHRYVAQRTRAGRAAEDTEDAQTSTRSATAGNGAAGGATRALASRQLGRPGGPFLPLPFSATERRKRKFFIDLLAVVRQQIRPLPSANKLHWHRLALTRLGAPSRRSPTTCGAPKVPPKRYP